MVQTPWKRKLGTKLRRTETLPKFGQYKKTAKIVLAQIRNIVAGMDSEEKDKIYEDIFEENSIVTMDSLRISSVIMTDSKGSILMPLSILPSSPRNKK